MKLTWNNKAFQKPKTVTYVWRTEYAADVHSDPLTGRPWVYRTVQQYTDVVSLMQNRLNSTGNVTRAFEDTGHDLSRSFTRVMSLPVFYYPGITQRTNGEVVGSPRNIIDTKELIESQYYFFTG